MTGMLPTVSLLPSLSFSRHTKGECKLEKNAEKIILSQKVDDFSLWLNPHVRSKEDFLPFSIKCICIWNCFQDKIYKSRLNNSS